VNLYSQALREGVDGGAGERALCLKRSAAFSR
jgi:hypothetical protein